MELTPEQASAADGALQTLTKSASFRHCVLAGYAGTGKTFTTQKIAGDLVGAGYAVTAITHTRKALGVLRAAMPDGVETMTAFQALGWTIDPKTQEPRMGGRHRLTGTDALLVDECSMVDAPMFSGICDIAERQDIPVLWVGDPAQLPPIGYEDSPVFTTVQTQYRLNSVVRQARESPIIALSMLIRSALERGTPPTASELAEQADDDSVCILSGGASTIAEYVCDAREHGLDARAIGFTNKAVMRIGGMVAKRMHGASGGLFAAGDPVTFGTRYGESIDTDATGTVVSVSDDWPISKGRPRRGPMEIDCLDVTVKMDGSGDHVECLAPVDSHSYHVAIKRLKDELARNKRRSRELKNEADRIAAKSAAGDCGDMVQACQDAYADLRYVYSMTAHKSQGSTFDVAIIDWQDILKNNDSRNLCRMAYVACTRPSTYLVIVA